MLAGNLCASAATGYWMLLIAHFISGLPHGAYFGVGSIVAGKLADEGKGAEAVSIMVAGMTVANLFGVPLGTSLSHLISWLWDWRDSMFQVLFDDKRGTPSIG